MRGGDGVGVGVGWGLAFKGPGVSVWEDNEGLEMDDGDSCATI